MRVTKLTVSVHAKASPKNERFSPVDVGISVEQEYLNPITDEKALQIETLALRKMVTQLVDQGLCETIHELWRQPAQFESQRGEPRVKPGAFPPDEIPF